MSEVRGWETRCSSEAEQDDTTEAGKNYFSIQHNAIIWQAESLLEAYSHYLQASTDPGL
jgi:hypothetical protein